MPPALLLMPQDELYLQYLTDACHDAVRRLLGPHRALRWASETRTLAELLYFALTTGSGLQTLGEEYCDILQVAGGGTAGAAAPPGPTRRGVLVLLQALGPYLAERLAAPEDDGFAAWQQAQAAARAESARQQRQQRQQQQQETQPATAAALLLQRVAAAAQQLAAATQHAARPVTRHLPAAASFLTQHGGTLVRIHLALFYIFGLYYQPSKRVSGKDPLLLNRCWETGADRGAACASRHLLPCGCLWWRARLRWCHLLERVPQSPALGRTTHCCSKVCPP
jgi:peroxin-10